MDPIALLRQANAAYPVTRIFWVGVGILAIMILSQANAIGWGALGWALVAFLLVVLIYPVFAYFVISKRVPKLVGHVAAAMMIFYCGLIAAVSVCLFLSLFWQIPRPLPELLRDLGLGSDLKSVTVAAQTRTSTGPAPLAGDGDPPPPGASASPRPAGAAGPGSGPVDPPATVAAGAGAGAGFDREAQVAACLDAIPQHTSISEYAARARRCM